MADLGQFFGFSIETENTQSLFKGFSLENRENIYVNFVDQNGFPVSEVDITFEGQQYTTDTNGFIELFSQTANNEPLLSSKESGFIGNQYFFFESLSTNITVTNVEAPLFVEIVMQVLVVDPNFAIRVLDKSLNIVQNVELNVNYNIDFNDILNSGTSGIAGPIVVVPDISDQVTVTFSGNNIFKSKTFVYTKTDVDILDTVNFILEPQPETIEFLLFLEKLVIDLNLFYIFSFTLYGTVCNNIKNIVCQLLSLKKEIERLDIESSQEDLQYFECLKTYINDLIIDIDIKKISNTDYFLNG